MKINNILIITMGSVFSLKNIIPINITKSIVKPFTIGKVTETFEDLNT